MLESKRRAIIFIGLALILALLAGFLVLQKVGQLNSELGGMTEIYVANDNVASRQVIKPSDVTKKEVPNRYAKDTNYITSKKDLINKVSVVPLSKGDIITGNVLKPVSNVIDDNSRLITIYASDKVGFDLELESLDRADIVVSHSFDGKPKTEMFMTDVPVARVAKDKDKNFIGVALEVPVDEAPKLIHMQNYADSVRILKANVGHEENAADEKSSDKSNKESTQKQDKSKPAEKPVKKEDKPKDTASDKDNAKKAKE